MEQTYRDWENQLKHRWNKERTIITYKAHNGQDLPLPRYYKTSIYTDDQRQLLWLYAEDKGTKWVKGFEVIAANTVNKDYYERLLKETPQAIFFTGTVSPQRYECICKKYGFKNDGSQDNEIITKIHRLFLERIRKETGKSVKHWCVTEKGHTNTRRIHLHGLFYAREGQTKWQLTKLLYEAWIS